MKVWTIASVRQQRFCDKRPDHPDAQYYLEGELAGQGLVTDASLTFKEVAELVDCFSVQGVSDIVGQKMLVSDECYSFKLALSYCLLIYRTDNTYKPPTPEQLFERTVCELSNMRCPDFSDVDKATVVNAFCRATTEEWLKQLKAKILARTGGDVKISDADPAEFPEKYMQTHHLFLIGHGKAIKFFIAPIETPVRFF